MYTATTPTDTPVEIRISYRSGKVEVLSAWRTDAGTVGYSLTPASGSTPLALSNLQAKGTYPRKAVPGWQAEVVAYAKTGLGTVSEVR